MEIKKYLFDTKRIYFFCVFMLHFFISFSQLRNDTTYRRRIGFSVSSGISQADFSLLHQSPYLLNLPTNYNSRTTFSSYVGPIEKLFITGNASFTYAYKTGTYHNNPIIASSFILNPSILITAKVYRSNKSKIIRAIYPSLGISFPFATLNSNAKGKTVSGQDSAFYYEKSTFGSKLITAEVMIEFQPLWKDNFKKGLTSPVVFKIGYGLQFQNPTWYYGYNYLPPRNIANDSKINLGGFYATLGFNFWAFTK